MRNPYTLPLRVRRQRVDELRQAIAAIEAERAAVEARAAALVAQAGAERHLRSGVPELQGDPWFGWQRRTGAALAATLAGLAHRADALRADLRDELGQVGALEEAERRLLADERRKRDRRAQAAADDRAASQFLLGAAA